MQVRAIRTHTSPDGQYRSAGDEFEHHGELYRHVEETAAQPSEPVEPPAPKAPKPPKAPKAPKPDQK